MHSWPSQRDLEGARSERAAHSQQVLHLLRRRASASVLQRATHSIRASVHVIGFFIVVSACLQWQVGPSWCLRSDLAIDRRAKRGGVKRGEPRESPSSECAHGADATWMDQREQRRHVSKNRAWPEDGRRRRIGSLVGTQEKIRVY